MEITQLWEKLPLPVERLATFKKDIAEGKVPELPFYIIGQEELKQVIKKRIEDIDSSRMITNLIIAEYGNGKTNLLKYLELFFKTHTDFGIEVQYSRADVERTDLVLFLIKIVQDKYLDDLLRIIKVIRQQQDQIPTLVNNFQSNFREIQEYTNKLFDINNDDIEITEYLYLGTGRLSNKRYFDKKGIEQLHDFNRREILVLFLNILSFDRKFIVFAIDEIEKIREKSKTRFSHFLTSYRELVDLFNQIKGHYLLISLTNSVGSQEISTANEALYTRIKDDIVNITALKKKNDILELVTYLDNLFETEKDLPDIITSLAKKETPNNRTAIQEISKLLHAKDSNDTLDELLEKYDLQETFKSTETKLENDEAFKYINRKFFDPLEYYIESIYSNSANLNKQEKTFVVDTMGKKVHYFIFSTYLEDFENERIKISKLIADNDDFNVVVYSPIKLELTHSKLNLDKDDKVEIIDFEPKELFTLLAMYKENYDLEPVLGEIVSNYTRQKL